MIKYLLPLTLSTVIYSHELAITFDDLPSQHNNKTDQLFTMTQNIIKALNNHKVHATGFVNEVKLNTRNDFAKNVEILKMWVDNGYPLGNHTYSHCAFSKTEISNFKEEVIKGATVSKKLTEDAGLSYNYFRHPYLDTGTDKNKRTEFEIFLQENGMIISPVTINSDDWIFNKYLLLFPENTEIIIQQYLEHIKNTIIFSEYVSQQIFGRNIKHILLVHVNFLTAITINQLLQTINDLNYQIVPLEQVMQDEAYQETDNYFGTKGPCWLYRWAYSKNIQNTIDWTQAPQAHNYFKEYPEPNKSLTDILK